MTKVKANYVLIAGVSMMGLALVWWFLYYAQIEGMFGLFLVKLSCLTGLAPECPILDREIARTGGWIPTFQPILWWLGLVVTIAGQIMLKKATKAAK